MIVNFTNLAGLAVAVLLAGCSSTLTPATQLIQIPVPVPCVKVAPVRPEYEFDRLPVAASDGDKILALVRDWAKYRKYVGEMEAVIIGCR